MNRICSRKGRFLCCCCIFRSSGGCWCAGLHRCGLGVHGAGGLTSLWLGRGYGSGWCAGCDFEWNGWCLHWCRWCRLRGGRCRRLCLGEFLLKLTKQRPFQCVACIGIVTIRSTKLFPFEVRLDVLGTYSSKVCWSLMSSVVLSSFSILSSSFLLARDRALSSIFFFS